MRQSRSKSPNENLLVIWSLNNQACNHDIVTRLNEAARAQYLASEEGRRAVITTLIGDVANTYYDLREADLELATSAEERVRARAFHLEVAKRLEKMARGFYRAGTMLPADFRAARASLRGQIQRLERQLGSIAVDLGQAGRALPLPDRAVPPPSGAPALGVGLSLAEAGSRRHGAFDFRAVDFSYLRSTWG